MSEHVRHEINPRGAGAPKSLRPTGGGGGDVWAPPSNSTTSVVAINGKAFESSSKIIPKLLGSGFRSGQYRSHQRSSKVKFIEMPGFFGSVFLHRKLLLVRCRGKSNRKLLRCFFGKHVVKIGLAPS